MSNNNLLKEVSNTFSMFNHGKKKGEDPIMNTQESPESIAANFKKTLSPQASATRVTNEAHSASKSSITSHYTEECVIVNPSTEEEGCEVIDYLKKGFIVVVQFGKVEGDKRHLIYSQIKGGAYALDCIVTKIENASILIQPIRKS